MMSSETFFNTMHTWTLWGIGAEILLLILLVPALLKVSQVKSQFVDNFDSLIYQIRDLRYQLRKAKEGIETTKVQLPSIMTSGPLKLMLPLLSKFL